jgi:hypothetical protein
MKRIIFEVTIEEPDTFKDIPDDQEAENLASCILDGMGFPEDVSCTAKVLRREPSAS